jgi:pilus assembly protein CpaB
MGRWRAIIPIVLALVVALTASVFLYKWMKQQTAPKKMAREKVETVKAAVAKVYLPAGTKLKKDTLQSARFLKESLPAGYFSDINKLSGRVVIAPVKPKELVLESRLAPISVKTGGVAAIVAPGKRAMSIKGGSVLGVSGFIRPGNRVDILMMTKGKSKIVFENIRVLATGKALGKDPKKKTSPASAYTFEVTPEEAERLALVTQGKGKIRLALRNVMDTETVLTTGANLKETLAYYRPIVPTDRYKPKPLRRAAGPARPAVGRSGYSVEIIKGLERTIKEY